MVQDINENRMKIKINSNWLEFENGRQLQNLLEQLMLKEKNGIAVAVNATVIPKRQWQHYALQENDEVIIIEATQGG
ncbi:MAG TPA: sulfur carrier protein ThiS [Chitinophagales bacterium]|nr:sulfur carrier protein ThiS [Chitinophagales bacterium]